MNALDALLTRRSSPRLCAPAPSPEQLENILQAGLRAADHALLRPWRMLSISGEGLDALGELFVRAELAAGKELDTTQEQKLRDKPKRAPLIIVALAKLSDHEKVPAIEQEYSAAAAVQAMSLAAYAQELGSMWRTGGKAYDATVRQGLGVAANEKIVGFLYLGTPSGPLKGLVEQRSQDFMQKWPS